MLKEKETGYCFVLLRPEAVTRNLSGIMISKIEELNCEIMLLELQEPAEARIRELYQKKELDNWRDEIVQNHMQGKIIVMLVRGGQRICHEVSEKVASLREQYALDQKLNCIHSSDSSSEALREGGIFFPYFKPPE